MLNRYTLCAFTLCSLLLFACNKKEDEIPTQVPGQIFADCPDVAYLDSTTVFTTNALEGYDVLWDFGDSTTSTEHNPTHLFRKMGKYYIKFTVSKDGTSPYVLYDSVIVTNRYFKRMEGLRNWHYSVHYSVVNGRSIDSTYIYPDQQFGLTLQLPDAIVLPDNNIYKGTTLGYSGIKDGYLSFWAFNGSIFPNIFDMYYNVDTDVITIKYTGFSKNPNSMGGATITSFVVTAISY